MMTSNGPDDLDAMTCEQINQELIRVARLIQEVSLRREAKHRSNCTVLEVNIGADAPQEVLLGRFRELLEARIRKRCLGWAIVPADAQSHQPANGGPGPHDTSRLVQWRGRQN
jgi:hypothetical protein